VSHAETCHRLGSVKFIFGKDGYLPGQAVPVDYNKHNILGQMAQRKFIEKCHHDEEFRVGLVVGK
jgi:hypothetical protein